MLLAYFRHLGIALLGPRFLQPPLSRQRVTPEHLLDTLKEALLSVILSQASSIFSAGMPSQYFLPLLTLHAFPVMALSLLRA